MSAGLSTATKVLDASPIDPRWFLYPETILELGSPCRLRIDLRAPIDNEVREEIAASGLACPFAVVTACDPGGRLLDDLENDRRASRLDEEVAGLGVPACVADGVSIDGRHRERGWALGVDLATAMLVAERHGQSALFWFDGDRFHLVPVLEPHAATIPLPMNRATGGTA